MPIIRVEPSIAAAKLAGSAALAKRSVTFRWRCSVIGATTDGYSSGSTSTVSPARQSRLSTTMATPSATDDTKPISAGAT